MPDHDAPERPSDEKLKVEFRFGIMAAPFAKQIRQQGLRIKSVAEVEQCDKDSEALSRLTIRGIITERTRDAGRVKVLRKLLTQCKVKP